MYLDVLTISAMYLRYIDYMRRYLIKERVFHVLTIYVTGRVQLSSSMF